MTVCLDPDRLFSPDAGQRCLARELYASVADSPIVSPHGHVDPALLADPDATFGTPADLLVIPDHYVFRMLYSQGVPLEALGIPWRAGGGRKGDGAAVETDHRKIWQTFADHYFLFRGTPSGLWLDYVLAEVLGVQCKLTAPTAQAVFDEIAAKLASPAFRPRALFERFRIEVLATTDAVSDPLGHHQRLRASGWHGRVVPTFRPDGVVHLHAPGWLQQVDALSQASGIAISSYSAFIRALEERRAFFKRMGATATDQSGESAYTGWLEAPDAEAIFQRALQGRATAEDARRFHGHMLMEMARMSCEDGLVMQFHAGIVRGHNPVVRDRFGGDMGGDIPICCEFATNMRPLLEAFGNDPRLTLILFTLDETTYARELAPLAGHYPALRLGPPWWFHDSPNGMRRYLDQIIDTAGLYNTAGFNDDTRAFCSIPARHDVWRRVGCDWLAGLVVRGQIDEADAAQMAADMAAGLARRTYRL